MLTMQEQTDLEAGVLTIQDDADRINRYVRRNRNANARTEDIHLVQIGNTFAPVQGFTLDTRNFPPRLMVAVRIDPTVQHGTVTITTEYPVVHEYHENERAYLIWEKFRDVQLEGGEPNVLEIKRMLDRVDPQPVHWTVGEVEVELRRWLEDKGEA